MKAQIGFAIAIALLATPVTAAGYKITPLVSDQPGVAPVTDPDLVNPWGAAQASDGLPIWVSDNGSGESTFYNRTTGVKQAPVVAIPHGLPTGIVAPVGVTFTVSNGTKSGAAAFIFDSISGVISGWAPSVDQNDALIAVDNGPSGAVYTGLALDTANKHLLAANFAQGVVEIYNTSFSKIGQFKDDDAPKSFGPFNVAVLNGKIYVAYAKRQHSGAARLNGHALTVPGAGKGFVDVFNLDGTFDKRLISGNPLNSPWGMAIAPSNFGTLSGKLLVGNFPTGGINAFDKDTGALIGAVANKKGKALNIDGLWALDAGPGTSTVQFTAGPVFETHGLIGNIKPN
jgi:uncharacterized protein (TIGR03118 family)